MLYGVWCWLLFVVCRCCGLLYVVVLVLLHFWCLFLVACYCLVVFVAGRVCLVVDCRCRPSSFVVCWSVSVVGVVVVCCR